jgi:hypothetical protein
MRIENVDDHPPLIGVKLVPPFGYDANFVSGIRGLKTGIDFVSREFASSFQNINMANP